jgi:hypothetical protein
MNGVQGDGGRSSEEGKSSIENSAPNIMHELHQLRQDVEDLKALRAEVTDLKNKVSRLLSCQGGPAELEGTSTAHDGAGKPHAPPALRSAASMKLKNTVTAMKMAAILGSDGTTMRRPKGSKFGPPVFHGSYQASSKMISPMPMGDRSPIPRGNPSPHDSFKSGSVGHDALPIERATWATARKRVPIIGRLALSSRMKRMADNKIHTITTGEMSPGVLGGTSTPREPAAGLQSTNNEEESSPSGKTLGVSRARVCVKGNAFCVSFCHPRQWWTDNSIARNLPLY